MNRFSKKTRELLMHGTRAYVHADIVAIADLGGIDDSVFSGPVRSLLRLRLGFLETYSAEWDKLVFLFICFLEHLNDDEIDELVMSLSDL